MIYEKYEAMEYYREFHKKIKDDINLRQSLIVGCRNNVSIEKHLSHTSYEDGPSKPNYLERTSFNEKNDFSKCDHLISLSNFYNHNTCDVSTKIYFLNSETWKSLNKVISHVPANDSKIAFKSDFVMFSSLFHNHCREFCDLLTTHSLLSDR